MKCSTEGCKRDSTKKSKYCRLCLMKKSTGIQLKLNSIGSATVQDVPSINTSRLENINQLLFGLVQNSNTFYDSHWKKQHFCEQKQRIRPVSFHSYLNVKFHPYNDEDKEITNRMKTAKILSVGGLRIYFTQTICDYNGFYYYVKSPFKESLIEVNNSNKHEILTFVEQSYHKGCYIHYAGDTGDGKVSTCLSQESLASNDYQPEVEKQYVKRDNLFINYLKQYIHTIKNNSVILDVAGGNGRLADKILDELYKNKIFVTYIIIDFNSSSISQASKKLYKHQCSGHKVFLFNDTFRDIIKKEFVDIIISSGGVINNEIVDYLQAKRNIKLMSQYLKKGGLLLATGQSAVILSSKDYKENGLFLEGTVGLHLNKNGKIEDIDQFHQVIKVPRIASNRMTLS